MVSGGAGGAGGGLCAGSLQVAPQVPPATNISNVSLEFVGGSGCGGDGQEALGISPLPPPPPPRGSVGVSTCLPGGDTGGGDGLVSPPGERLTDADLEALEQELEAF